MWGCPSRGVCHAGLRNPPVLTPILGVDTGWGAGIAWAVGAAGPTPQERRCCCAVCWSARGALAPTQAHPGTRPRRGWSALQPMGRSSASRPCCWAGAPKHAGRYAAGCLGGVHHPAPGPAAAGSCRPLLPDQSWPVPARGWGAPSRCGGPGGWVQCHPAPPPAQHGLLARPRPPCSCQGPCVHRGPRGTWDGAAQAGAAGCAGARGWKWVCWPAGGAHRQLLRHSGGWPLTGRAPRGCPPRPGLLTSAPAGRL